MEDYNDLIKTEFRPREEIDIYNPFTSANSNSRGIKVSFEDNIVYETNCQTHNESNVSVSAMDVAVYILDRIGKCTTMKLHKLLYYCQAWSLVWDEKPLFDDRIEAWANGPVVKRLFSYHKGLFEVSSKDFSLGNPKLLNKNQRDTVDSVLNFYGDKSAQWLINLSHSEAPWLNARKGLSPSERGSIEIKLSDMADYFSSL